MRGRNLLAFALLVGSTAIVDGTVLANGRADGGKTTICHATGDGQLVPITVSARAVEAHVAHGDPVIGTDVDEHCEPLSLSEFVQPAGCYALVGSGTVLRVMVDHRTVTAIGGRSIHFDEACGDASGMTWPVSAVTWAADWTVAAEQCRAEQVATRTAVPTVTPHLFWCLP